MSNYQYTSFGDDFDNPFGDPRANETPRPQIPASTVPPPTTVAPTASDANLGKVQVSGLDEFNPFEKRSGVPAVLPTGDLGSGANPGQPPAYTASAGIRITSGELERRQQELEARENELRRREEELRQRNLQSDNQQNNWPPLPSFVPIGPCFYQDIDVEIPLEYRQLVRFGYYLWLGHVGVFLFNIVAAIAYLIGSQGDSSAGSTFGLSIIFAALFIPASFMCWFRPLYKAFRSDSSFYYFFFFIVFGAQIIVIFIQSLGINFFAGCGWINGITLLGKNSAAAAIMLICGSIFTILGILDVLLLTRVHRIYRGSGASFEKAKAEFSQGVMSNPTVRSAAMEAGTAAVRGGVGANNNAGRF